MLVWLIVAYAIGVVLVKKNNKSKIGNNYKNNAQKRQADKAGLEFRREMTEKDVKAGLWSGKINQQQALILRLGWPLRKDWEFEVIGRKYTEREIQIYLALCGPV